MTTERLRVAVLGAGPGGYPAAFLAAERGFDVTLIDPRANPGGVCLYIGCIPSKALLHAAGVIREAEHASAFGIEFGAPTIDLDGLRGWKDGVVEKLTGGLGTLARARKVRMVHGLGRFVDAHTIRVERDGELAEVTFDFAIVATGSSPAMPAALRLDSDRVWDSTAALELREVPGTLLIVGGGYIGLEMATLYAALGSKVTVVEATGTLLAGADADLVRVLAKSLEGRLEAVLLETSVTALREHAGGGVEVDLAGVEEQTTRTFDRVLVAVGRRPNSADLGLEHTSVTTNERGFIRVDHQRRTDEPSIFAIGDVAGEPMLAHKATHEARVAVEVIAGEPAAWEPAAIPAVVYTDPEIAWCGLTEQEARARGIEVEVTRFPWTASGRALTLGRTDGSTKILVEPGTERVLGVGIVGPGAGELIAEGVLAVEMGARLDDLRMSIHPHPSLTETIMEAAEVFFNTSPHYIARRR
ncbi:MAG: dihydrolipoyl dehydrogenase [Dehalococcoidia bacterium]|nr:dihydrolipoyl dehydrogenase [Dehalococcoidia bacterium]